jgi:hypothetical protein
MTEGRGPMVNDVCFEYKQDAEDYIDTQPGIMGRKCQWSQAKYGDWDVIELTIASSLSEVLEIQNKAKVKQALNKLTPEEIKLLGIQA